MSKITVLSDMKVGDIEISTRKNKKYVVRVSEDLYVHFGQQGCSHYHDKMGYYARFNHGDKKKRAAWRARFKAITKNGKPAYKDKTSAVYYAWKYLW